MTIFAILLPNEQPALAKAITDAYPTDFYEISKTQFLVSATATSAEVSARIGVYDAKNPNAPLTGNAVILATSSYFGRGPTTLWEWMKTKLEAKPVV